MKNWLQKYKNIKRLYLLYIKWATEHLIRNQLLKWDGNGKRNVLEDYKEDDVKLEQEQSR